MTDAHDIPQSGARLVWVFSYDGTIDGLEALSPEALAEALGLQAAPEESAVEWFDVSTLNDYGFSRYLSEASGMEIRDEAAKLDALDGPVLLVFSTGLNEKDTTFAPKPPFRLVGRYGTPVELPPHTGLESMSAEGQLPQGAPPASNARISGMVATVVLIFLAIFVVAFVWIGG
ncbi:hypothetical protein [Celeribacter indicus]|uniref:Uncharacterized protein n=1 Tax=Celeribacter indicus TaxID=1208324 RepID=A0A0B5E7F4_9RHOB|nr:hypothetical protein [Celeribacter indicus]AJE48996.1 hypothetical protein P73_4281 [Celeribacter indicus]SDW43270.1 hypothetical protein SAMN05443573_103205 [Celeribacter indicus]